MYLINLISFVFFIFNDFGLNPLKLFVASLWKCLMKRPHPQKQQELPAREMWPHGWLSFTTEQFIAGVNEHFGVVQQ